jgi:hypothetical protein
MVEWSFRRVAVVVRLLRVEWSSGEMLLMGEVLVPFLLFALRAKAR